MNAAARLGFVLLAAYWAINGFQGLMNIINVYLHLDSLREPLDVAQVLWAFAAAGLGVGILSWLPAWLLYRFSATLADRLFPSGEVPPTELPASDLYLLGCVLLALWLAVSGAAGLAGALVSVASLAWTNFFMWQSFLTAAVSSAVYLAAAWLVYGYAVRRLSGAAGVGAA